MMFGRKPVVLATFLIFGLTIGGLALVRPTEANADFRSEFIAKSIGPAQASMREWKVPASVTIAQAIIESGWGRSGLNKPPNNNYFGIKCTSTSSPYQTGCVRVKTAEWYSGKYVNIVDGFRTYASMTDSYRDHGRFLGTIKRYQAAFKYPNDADQFVREVAKAGYATSPTYASTLIKVMKQYNLYQYDKLGSAPAAPQPATPTKPAIPAKPSAPATTKPATPTPPATNQPNPAAAAVAPAKPSPAATTATQPGANQPAPAPTMPVKPETPAPVVVAPVALAPAAAPAPKAEKPKVVVPKAEIKKTQVDKQPKAAAQTKEAKPVVSKPQPVTPPAPPEPKADPAVDVIPDEKQDEEAAANRAELFDKPEQFIESVAASAQKAAARHDGNASEILAATIYHSSWGQSVPAQVGNNLMELKCTATPSPKQTGCVEIAQIVPIAGSSATTVEFVKYRTYANAEDALLDYVETGGSTAEVPTATMTALIEQFQLASFDSGARG